MAEAAAAEGGSGRAGLDTDGRFRDLAPTMFRRRRRRNRLRPPRQRQSLSSWPFWP